MDLRYSKWLNWDLREKGFNSLSYSGAKEYLEMGIGSDKANNFEKRQLVRESLMQLAEGKGDWPPPDYGKMGPKLQEMMQKALFLGLARRG